MVEIKRTDVPGPSQIKRTHEDDDKFRLLYSKSKVYVNPTAYARDNIPGFVALVKRVSSNRNNSVCHFPNSLTGGRQSYLPSCLDPRESFEREGCR